MAYVNDEARDGGLDWVVSNGTRLDMCNAQPTTYTEATSTYSIGNKTGVTCVLGDGDTDGRKATIPSVSGSTTSTDTCTHWALTDGSSVLVAWGTIQTPVELTSGVNFSSNAIDITIRDAA